MEGTYFLVDVEVTRNAWCGRNRISPEKDEDTCDDCLARI